MTFGRAGPPRGIAMHRASVAAVARLPRRRVLRFAGAVPAAMLVAGLAPRARAQPAPRRVLIIHSFGRSIAPYNTVIATFRSELAARSGEPVDFMEAALDATHPIGPDEQASFAAYLRARFTHPPPDLVVSSAGPAAQFLASKRDALFPGVPILLTAIDVRIAERVALRPGDAAVAVRIDLRRALDAMLRVLPHTRTIAVVIGTTPLERFWRDELRREGAALAGRVEFVWLDELSLEQMQVRIAALPADSVVYYALLVVDAAGVPHERLEALAELRRAAQVPIFSIFESELGQGVVGGPYLSQRRVGRETAAIALRILGGARQPAPEIVVIGMDTTAYDLRELRRWRIDESRLPPGSELLFRPPSPWVEYRQELIALAAVIVAQAALIAALLVQRARRRRAEQQARTLGGRLITAYDDEGRRIARELHDDVTQRLAGVSIELATLPRLAEPGARAAMEQSISGELASLSRDVHALAYRLHPSVIDDLGLAEALRIECGRLARRGPAAITFDAGAETDAVRGERALCLFRVAQEALRNAARHARATRIDVGVRSADGGIELRVADDGCGFDPAAARERASLGLASMRERVELLGGRLEIDSRSGAGTRVAAWLPAAEAA